MADPVNTGFDPEFSGPLGKFRAALKAQGIDTNIISGVRDDKAQAELVANRDATLSGRPLPYPKRGPVRVAAPVGSSTHEFGLGADVQPVHPADAERMHRLAQQFGLAMPNWGGADPYHVQLGNWQEAKASQAPPQPWPTLPPTPSQYASNTSAETPSSGGGFAIPGTTLTLGGGAPIAGALAETGPESSNAGGGSAQPDQPMDTRQLVYNKLTGAGLAPHQALGALYGLGGESRSSLDTTAYNPKDPGGAIGIAQWVGPRRAALEAFAKNRGTSVTDPNTQADFLVEELTNPKAATYQPGVLEAMKKAGNAADATNTWVANFERPSVNNWQARYKQGSAVGSLDSNNNFVVGSAKPSNTAVASNQPGGARDDIAVPGTLAAANQAAADNQSWFGRFTQGPIDPATGKPDPNAKTPMAQMASAVLDNYKGTQAKVEDAGPVKTALTDQAAPMARNVSPMGGALLPNVPQTYGQTLNSFSRPLSYNAAPPQGPQMAAAGFQGGYGAQVPGMSLNSLPALPEADRRMGFPGIRPLTLDDYGYQGAGYAS